VLEAFVLLRPLRASLVVLLLSTAAAAAQTTTTPLIPDPADPFFDDNLLHEIRLAINNKDWTTLKTNYLSNDYYPCDFRWGSYIIRNVGIRSRGTGSRSGVKPGLRVDFDRYTSNQKFLGLKSFVLRNNTQDQSNIHERLGMLFFRRMGVPASREAHAKLYVNDVYAGLYTIVEAVDRSFLGKQFGNDEGYLYKYDYNVDSPPYYFEYRGSDPAAYVPLPFKPETNEADPQPAPIVDMIRTVAEASDAAFRSQIAQFLDLRAVLKHVAIELFLGDADGFTGNWGMNNFYMHRPKNQTLFNLIPWDKSEAFRDGATYPIFHNIYDVPEALRNRLIIRALAYEDLRDVYFETLLECARLTAELPAETPGDTRGWMEREIERQYNQIRDAALADPEKPYSNEQFTQAIEAMITFARQRPDFVRSEVARYRTP
jgi:spore coat protein CotH